MNSGFPFSSTNKGNTAQELYNKGLALYLEQKHQQAVDMLELAVEHEPDHHEALGLLGQITQENGYIEESIECYALAIQANNNHPPYKQAFLDLIAYRPVVAFNQAMKDILLGCLVSDDMDLRAAHLPWFGLLQHDPAFKPFLKLLKIQSDSEFETAFLKADNHSVLSDPYFLMGLQKLIVFKAEFEGFLTHLRRFFLMHATSAKNPLTEAQTLMILASLACYCHETEYIFRLSDHEKAALETLKPRIESGKADDMDIALYACYAPLAALKNAQDLQRDYTGHPALSDIVALHITKILAREQIKKSIPARTPIQDAISEKVRAQYETFPYPRWKAFDPNIKNERCEGFLAQGRPKILVAGCGTGKEAIELAHVFPNASVLAVDLSLSSLSYGIEKAREHKIDNITFEQADILELGSVSAQQEPYDYIASSGVLHHMSEPEKGLSTLCKLLKTGGVMRLAFYSRPARSAINKARHVITQSNIGNDDQSIRNFRADIKTHLDKKTYENISSFADYFSMSECRDLIFHVQEHQYDLNEIKSLLSDHQLSFKEFYLHPDTLAAYHKMFPDDPAKTNLLNWEKFETKNPQTFVEMYRFWCVKK